MLKTYTSFIKVRYAETDQMGVVHHGNYPQYLEVARLEWLEALGISYKTMEEEGMMLLVYELKIKYNKPAYFDDTLKVVTKLHDLPTVRIIFDYSIYNQVDQLVTQASTELIFLNVKTNRPTRCPKYILEKL